MTFPEIIGLIISILALLFLFLRQVWDARERREHPQEYQKKQKEREKRLKQLMKTLDIEVEEDEEESVSLPRKEKPRESAQASQKPSLQLPKAPYIRPIQPVTQQRLDVQRKHVPRSIVYVGRKEPESRAARLIKQQRTLKDAVLLSEIIGLPKGMLTRDRH